MKKALLALLLLSSVSCFADAVQALNYLESRGWGGSHHTNTIQFQYHQPTGGNQALETRTRMYEAEMNRQRGMYAPRAVNNYYLND